MLERETADPGPWSVCGKGKCPCKQVWCSDSPIAYAVSGKWGDEYPSVRLVGDALEKNAEAYMEMIEYGEVPEAMAAANARLLAAAPELRDALHESRARVRKLEAYVTNQPCFCKRLPECTRCGGPTIQKGDEYDGYYEWCEKCQDWPDHKKQPRDETQPACSRCAALAPEKKGAEE